MIYERGNMKAEREVCSNESCQTSDGNVLAMQE